MTAPPLVRLGIRVRREQAELALAALLPVLPQGAEETEPDTGDVEYALYVPRGELPTRGRAARARGRRAVDVTLTDVAAGWERRWHEHLRPVEVASGGRRMRVRPPWEPAGGGQDVLEIVIDPGELFGAGTHATTQLCLELLLELDAGGALCDWGAGSGILAVAAARLGFAPVEAVELSDGAADVIRRNAAANGVAVRAVQADLTATPPPSAPTVTANLTLEVLQAIAARALERPPERMIASGVLAERADAVAGGVRAPRAGRGRAAGPRRVGRGAAHAARVGGRARVIRLAVRVARAHADAVLAELLELAPGGLEERESGEDAIEFVLYGAPGELPALPDVRAAAGDALVEVSTSEIPDDWSERWKAFHRPVDVSWRFRRLRVRPPWEPPLSDADAIDLVIDPGQAFGTGAHHTTRLCLELLLELEPARPAGRLGLRHGCAGDRRGATRLRPGARVRLRPGRGRGDGRERGGQRRAGDRRVARRPAPRRGPVGSRRRRQPGAPAAARGRGADDPPAAHTDRLRPAARGDRRGRRGVRPARAARDRPAGRRRVVGAGAGVSAGIGARVRLAGSAHAYGWR